MSEKETTMSFNRIQFVVSPEIPEPQQTSKAATPGQSTAKTAPCDCDKTDKPRKLAAGPRPKAIV